MLESATRLYIPWPGWKRGWGWSACWQYQWGCSRASPTSTGWPTFPSGRGGWSLVPVPPYFLSRPWSRSRHFSGPGLGPGPGQIYGPVTQWLTVPGGGADGGGWVVGWRGWGHKDLGCLFWGTCSDTCLSGTCLFQNSVRHSVVRCG